MTRRGLQARCRRFGVVPALSDGLRRGQERRDRAGPELRLRPHPARRAVHRGQAPAADQREAHAQGEDQGHLRQGQERASSSPAITTTTRTATSSSTTSSRRSCAAPAAGAASAARAPSVNVAAGSRARRGRRGEDHREPGAALSPLRRLNPLHADPSFAKAFGFDKPILHGLCTFGFADAPRDQGVRERTTRASSRASRSRFADSVFPGETLVTEMWKESDTKIVFRCKVKERDKVVISNAAIELYKEIPKAARSRRPSRRLPRRRGGRGERRADERRRRSRSSATTSRRTRRSRPRSAKTSSCSSSPSPDSAWTLDLKNGKGARRARAATRRDCTLELSRRGLLRDGRPARPTRMKLYSSGKLKIAGDVMASQKLEFLKKIDPEAGGRGRREAARRGRRRGGGGGGRGGGAERRADERARRSRSSRDYIEKNPDARGQGRQDASCSSSASPTARGRSTSRTARAASRAGGDKRRLHARAHRRGLPAPWSRARPTR